MDVTLDVCVGTPHSVRDERTSQCSVCSTAGSCLLALCAGLGFGVQAHIHHGTLSVRLSCV